MNMKLVGVVVAVFVTITVIASILMPVIKDASDDTYAVYNNESSFYSVVVSSDDEVVTGSIDADNKLTINGNEITTTSQRYIIMGDTFYLRYSGTAHSFNYYNGSSIVAINHVPVSFTASNGTLTYVDESTDPVTTVEVEYTWMAYNTAESDATYREIVTTSGVKTIYVNSIEDIYAVSKTDTSIISIYKGQITDNTVPVNASVSINPRDIDNVKGVQYLNISTTVANSDIQYTYTEGGSDHTEFYGNVLVPYEVKGFHDPPGEAFVNILNVIPVVVILSVLVAVVALVFRSRE